MTSPLWQARFFKTVNHLKDLPNTEVPEIAFAGRSNAGKSTAINILCNQNGLAKASKTPGRTQHLNFFAIGGGHAAQHRKDPIIKEKIRAFLVDLPGYGYAKVPHTAKEHWQELLSRYLLTRPQLVGLILMMDSRHPFQPLDVQLIEWFLQTKKPIHCLLTKADKLSKNNAQKVLLQTRSTLKSYVDENQNPFELSAQLFSAQNRLGVDDANLWTIRHLNLIEEPK